MKLAGGMLCGSHAATAVCVPGDALSMVAARHAGRPAVVGDARLTGVRYTRLGDGKPRSRGRERRQAAMAVVVALPMAEKGSREAAPPPPAAKRPAPAPARAMPAPPPADLVFQVVVMKVAIHCQGCAGKVRKHISKMEGVTSFSIDLESKRVTVTGHVSPAVVLESVSKVKKAELWPSCM